MNETSDGLRRFWPAGLVAATLLAAAIRFGGLDRQSFWVDEYLFTLTASLRSLAHVIHRPDGYPPTMALLFRWLIHAGLGSDWWLRFPSALAGTLAVPMTFALARRLASPKVALVAAMLLAINPLAVWYSQEAGAYSLVLLVGLLSTWALLSLLEGGGAGAAIGYAAAAGAGFGLHYYFIFVLAAQAPFGLAEAIRRPERRRPIIGAAILCVVTVGAWLPLFIGDVAGQQEQDRDRGLPLLALPYTAQAFAGGFAIGPSVRSMHPAVRAGVTPWSAFGADVFLSAAAIMIALSLFLLAIPVPWNGRRALLIALVVVPVLGPYLNSLLGVGYRPRYALVALPYALLCFAGGLLTRRRRAARVLLGLLMAIEVAGLVRSQGPRHCREDNRSAAAYVAAAGGGDGVLIGEGADPFERYASGIDRLVDLDSADARDDAALARRLDPLLSGRGDLWLVSSRPWTEDPDGRVAAWLGARLPRGATQEFAGVTLERFVRGAR